LIQESDILVDDRISAQQPSCHVYALTLAYVVFYEKKFERVSILSSGTRTAPSRT
jgi:hypothetical protein